MNFSLCVKNSPPLGAYVSTVFNGDDDVQVSLFFETDRLLNLSVHVLCFRV